MAHDIISERINRGMSVVRKVLAGVHPAETQHVLHEIEVQIMAINKQISDNKSLIESVKHAYGLSATVPGLVEGTRHLQHVREHLRHAQFHLQGKDVGIFRR